jgi:uracil phosphoribosyltransferase
MNNLVLIDHPLIRRDLTILRDRNTPNPVFRTALRRISSHIAIEVTRHLKLKPVRVETPLEQTKGYRLGVDVVIIPVLRAGLGLVDGFLDVLPEARVGHVGLYRNEQTLQPVDYYSKFPRNLRRSQVFLLDPMLATGGSGNAALRFLKEKGAKNIHFVTLLAAPEGIKRVTEAHPDVPLYTTVIDRKLNNHGYILPGLGDAGDRIFGTD